MEIMPKDMSFGADGGPAFDVTIVTSNAGVESRNLVSELPRFEYDIPYMGILPERRKRLTSFFIVHAGPAYSFRFFDHLDYEAEAGEGVFVGIDGSPAGDYQMFKLYTFGSRTFYRKITKPISGAISITGSGTLDYETGIVTGGTPTAWTGQFHMHARFNIARLNAAIRDRNNTRGLIVDIQSLPVVEVKTAD